ncbi:hypothetical protein [Nonomuraea recticatena]|uniref:Uncharacterized protein n=1 Tax=Nonomuraea recticatena TaxID=46178 RepID=A0ABN3RIU7_9ACTN
MPPTQADSHDAWSRLRPDAVQGVKDLLAQLERNGPTQDLIDVYLYSKRILAEAMEARMSIELGGGCETFHQLRERLAELMQEQFGGKVPEEYLGVPFGSHLHEKLFLLLLQRQGEEVPGTLIRVVAGDSVHTERRVRELRELGLDIETGKIGNVDTYKLNSLHLDTSFIPTIIFNTARNKKHRFMKQSELKRILGLD